MTEGRHIINMKPKINLLWSSPLDPFLERPQSKEHYRHTVPACSKGISLANPEPLVTFVNKQDEFSMLFPITS